jgi:hypothetical protein
MLDGCPAKGERVKPDWLKEHTMGCNDEGW